MHLFPVQVRGYEFLREKRRILQRHEQSAIRRACLERRNHFSKICESTSGKGCGGKPDSARALGHGEWRRGAPCRLGKDSRLREPQGNHGEAGEDTECVRRVPPHGDRNYSAYDIHGHQLHGRQHSLPWRPAFLSPCIHRAELNILRSTLRIEGAGCCWARSLRHRWGMSLWHFEGGGGIASRRRRQHGTHCPSWPSNRALGFILVLRDGFHGRVQVQWFLRRRIDSSEVPRPQH
mmetsp:Transcript_7815/g.15079  ORF Transcript_7815/g.15079 Transcript_7815/m.15079 type:complete len:235 (-) Transcript_7815:704-1408(-)